MNEITKKFAALTAEQSKALAEAMNSEYNNPPITNDTENIDAPEDQEKNK